MGATGNAPDDIPLLGINRFVVAADTDREAIELGRRGAEAIKILGVASATAGVPSKTD
jgi:hypothetical protein